MAKLCSRQNPVDVAGRITLKVSDGDEGSGHESNATEGEVGGAPPAPAGLEAEDEEDHVGRPDGERDGHERVEITALDAEAPEADSQPERECGHGDRDRARGQPVERFL